MNQKTILSIIALVILVIVVAYFGSKSFRGDDQVINDIPTSQSQTLPTPETPTNSNPPVVSPTVTIMHQATLITTLGTIVLQLDPVNAPKTVENFEKLINQGFYNGVRFHRVIKDFMIQTGDPLSKDLAQINRWGTGGPDYKFDDELTGKETYPQGTLAMANAGPNTNGSQFFIVTANPAPLPPAYTVFGKVISGMDVAMKIEAVKTGVNDRPVTDVIITSITLK